MSKVLLVVRTITKSIAGLAVMVGSFQMATSGLCDELSPIKPERVSSSVDDSYCSARYRDALSREDGTVLYVCGVAERERPAGVQYGHVIAIDRPDGSVRFYHVTGEAGVEPEDEVLYTVTEPHPAWGWCYDGTARSLVLVGYRKYVPLSDTIAAGIARRNQSAPPR